MEITHRVPLWKSESHELDITTNAQGMTWLASLLLSSLGTGGGNSRVVGSQIESRISL